jgi:phospholipase C
MTLSHIDHFVVLMLENRSFDNLLGGLYPDDAPGGRRFDGVLGKQLALPIPDGADASGHEQVTLRPATAMDSPNPDPGEEWQHVNTQLYGTIRPAGNALLAAGQMRPPYNLQDPLPATPPMNGFVLDYYRNFRQVTGQEPAFGDYRVIMEYFPPETLPVLSMLARQFAVCDHSFAGVPSQTFANRSFFHAAQSSGLVNNYPYECWLDNDAATIFDRLEQKGRSWRVYWDESQYISLTALIHLRRVQPYITTHWRHMDRFWSDVASGDLPHYTFIEPRMLLSENDMHPPFRLGKWVAPSTVAAGERLVADVYNAIRRSRSPVGSNWRNTALLVTFDEHGGTFDHVPPPPAVPPCLGAPAGQLGFKFDRLGVRVPMIVCSAYTRAGTIINTTLDSTSVIKTLERRWRLDPLTQRDRAATDLAEAFNLDVPREAASVPQASGRPAPAADPRLDRPLTPLQRAMVSTLMYAAGHLPAEAALRSARHALLYLDNHAGALGGGGTAPQTARSRRTQC